MSPPPHDPLLELTAAESAALIAHGELRAQDLAARAIARVEQTAGLGGLLQHDAAALLRAAQAADAMPRHAAAARPLHGVPLVLKDNIDVAGLPTTAGSRALAGLVPTRHADVTERLLAAGALVLGKANMHEFAYGITNNNAAFAAARNPHDPRCIPGGSSGGTAVVVASQACAAGIGTDTGGSIRIPAALCGLVGMRPSVGRWPTDGIMPIAATFDTPGPIARGVADCVLLDGVVTGAPTRLEPAGLSGLRLGIPREYFWSPLDRGVARLAEQALARLARAGVTLVPCTVADVATLCDEAMLPISLFETLPGLRGHFARHGWAFDARRIAGAIESPDVRAIFEALLGADAVSEAAYRRAMDELRPALQASYRRCFEVHGIDALLFPTTPLPAARIGEDAIVRLDGVAVPTFETFTRNTRPGALAGLPGISLPIGRTPQGLPVGMELDAAAGEDRRLLGIALAVEPLLAAPSEGTGIGANPE